MFSIFKIYITGTWPHIMYIIVYMYSTVYKMYYTAGWKEFSIVFAIYIFWGQKRERANLAIWNLLSLSLSISHGLTLCCYWCMVCLCYIHVTNWMVLIYMHICVCLHYTVANKTHLSLTAKCPSKTMTKYLTGHWYK